MSGNGIFNMFFDAAMAWNQIGYLLGGLVFFAFGGGLTLWYLYGHITGKRIRGKVLSVRVRDGSLNTTLGNLEISTQSRRSSYAYAGEMYYAVYEYAGPDGKVYQSGDSSGSNSLADKIPGMPVWLYVNPRHPEKIMRAGVIWLVFGLIFLAPSFIFFDLAFTRFKFNIFTILIPIGLAAHLAFKIKSKFNKPHELHDKVTQFLADAKTYKSAPGQPAASTLPAGRELTRDEIRTRLQAWQKTNRLVAPVVSLIGIALIVAGIHFGQSMAALLAVGQRTDGQVVRMESSYSSSNNGGYTYYPIVGFSLPDGVHQEFKDRIGSNPPSYARGDKVMVIYDPAQTKDVMIDRGIWNWALSGGLALAGGVLLLMALNSLSNSRRISRL